MRKTHRAPRPTLLMTMALALSPLLVGGCSNERDQRLAEMAERHVAEQAHQYERLAQQSQQIVEASRHLVEADAMARQQMIEAHAALQQGIQESQANVERQRDELEQERRDFAQQRHRDPIVAESVGMIALTLACALPLLLAGYVLYTVNNSKGDDPALGELLINDLVAEEPLLLRSSRPVPRLEQQARVSESSQSAPPE